MSDSLDQLLDEHFGVAETGADVPEQPSTEGEPEPVALEAPLEADTESSQDDAGTPLPPEAPTDTASASPAAPNEELTKAQQVIQNQQNLLRTIVDAQRQAVARQQEEQRLSELADRWENLPPDEAQREREQWIIATANDEVARARNEAQQLRDFQAQSEWQQRENAAKELFLNDLVVEYKFSPQDRELFEHLDTPESILTLADKLKTRRVSQTTSARAARAEQIRNNEALTTGLTTGGAAQATQNPNDFANIDDLLTSVLG